MDLDMQLLDLIRSEHFAFTRFGSYLQELRDRFGGAIAVDMFCLLRLELELSIEAKAMVMAREAGLEVPVTEDLRASLQEIAHLEASIGRTGLAGAQDRSTSCRTATAGTGICSIGGD